ncbi:MAG: hypothetical protein KA791_04635 [Flavobacteriales bacterium]|nr:hypothetical protein [Flavobacteriales bacterium]
MERRELYEPEDIEQLLIERPYDELLEMERAFVLRHLSGRDEYEAMRALLLKVHDDDANMAPIEAEPSVRAHVMDIFRSEQRPQWRIWLNSVHAFLLPKEASAMWRPALALGSVALVAWLVVVNMGRFEGAKVPQLAEVKDIKETRNIEEKATDQKVVEPSLEQQELRSEQAAPAANGVTFTSPVADEVMLDEPVFKPDASGAQASVAAEESPAPPPATVAQLDMSVAEDQVKDLADAEVQPTTPGEGAIRSDSLSVVTGATTHIVTSNELAHNYSFSNASAPQAVSTTDGTISTKSVILFAQREKAKKQEDRKRAVSFDVGNVDDMASADAGAYIDLLRAAW